MNTTPTPTPSNRPSQPTPLPAAKAQPTPVATTTPLPSTKKTLPPVALPKTPKDPSAPNKWRSFISTAGLLVTALLIALLINTFVIQSYQVDGRSMEPTLQNNDRLIVNKVPRTISRLSGHAYIPHRGDIIIFNQSNLPGFVGEKQLIKRVIGLPGEHVTVSNGKITVYNQSTPDGFNPDTSSGYFIQGQPTTSGSVDVELGDDELFVCGDNRNNSEDSRFFGPIKANVVVAKLSLRIVPLNQAKRF